MQELEITWQRATRIWWAWLWRAAALSVVCGGLIGFVIGLLGAMLGFRNLAPLNLVVGLVVGVVVGVTMLVTALKKIYPGFRGAFIAQSDSPPQHGTHHFAITTRREKDVHANHAAQA